MHMNSINFKVYIENFRLNLHKCHRLKSPVVFIIFQTTLCIGWQITDLLCLEKHPHNYSHSFSKEKYDRKISHACFREQIKTGEWEIDSSLPQGQELLLKGYFPTILEWMGSPKQWSGPLGSLLIYLVIWTGWLNAHKNDMHWGHQDKTGRFPKGPCWTELQLHC